MSNDQAIFFSDNIRDENNIDSFIEEIKDSRSPQYFSMIENKIVDELVYIIENFPSEQAKTAILRVKSSLYKTMEIRFQKNPLTRSFKSAVEGATSVALALV